MNEEREDPRLRPVVLQTSAPAPDNGRRSTRILTWVGGIGLAVAAAIGLVAGGTAVWSAVDPGSPAQSPAPLWIQPPPVVSNDDAKTTPPSPPRETATPDDHGNDDRSTDPTTTTSSSGSDDHSGRRTTGPTATTSSSGSDDHGGRGKTDPTATRTSSTSDNSGSDDDSGNSGHH